MKKQNDGTSYSDLLDVIRGYSVLDYDGKSYYFKHFTLVDFLRVECFREADIMSAVKSGIKKEQELLDSAIKIGSWKTKKEDELKSLQWTIKKSMSALDKIQDKTQRRIFNDQIKNKQKALAELKQARLKITNYSAEHLAETKKIGRMVDMSVFCDLDFKESVPKEVSLPLTAILFGRYAELNSRDHLLRASYFGGFFDVFVAQDGNSIQLFGCDITNITTFQKYLLVLSNSLFNKMKNVKMPEEVYGDPVKMFEYEEKEETDSKVSHGVDDLKMKVKARGGKLKAEDFLT